MRSQTLRFIFDHPLKQWPTGKKYRRRRKYQNVKKKKNVHKLQVYG